MVIVTSGKEYIDIDAYASILAYRELLKLQGEDAIAISSAKMNESITPYARDIGVLLDQMDNISGADFIVLDLSDPAYFDPIVDKTKVVEVIDHHAGHEKEWQGANAKATIELIGAVATLIYEKYKSAGEAGQMQKPIAELLMMAILDNTLNFRAKITTERDKTAYRELAKIAEVSEKDFAKKYFTDCQAAIVKNLATAVVNDTKTGHTADVLPDIFGQLTLWNGRYAVGHVEVIHGALSQLGESWLVNIISLSEGRSYLVVSDVKVLRSLEVLFGTNGDELIIELPEVWLRKEIVKKALEHEF